jgi:hypothetical protein
MELYLHPFIVCMAWCLGKYQRQLYLSLTTHTEVFERKTELHVISPPLNFYSWLFILIFIYLREKGSEGKQV